MKVYDEMAEYYDWIYSDDLDVRFYMNEAKNARGPVLEAACGTGRILLRLLQNGIDATGLDLSEGMLARLREKAKSLGMPVNAVCADMSSFKLEKRFNLIILPYRSFLHLPDEGMRRKTLQNLYAHLAHGGRIIIHAYQPSEEETSMQGEYHHYESEEMVSHDGRPYSLDWYLQYEPRGRVGHYRIVMKLESGEQKEFLMDLSFIENRAMESLLKSAGFRNIKPYCGFAYGQMGQGCKEVLWIAER